MTKEEKKIKLMQLGQNIHDPLINNFFDWNSNKMLDKKIEVFEELKKGTPYTKINGLYDILEEYPKDTEKVFWD